MPDQTGTVKRLAVGAIVSILLSGCGTASTNSSATPTVMGTPTGVAASTPSVVDMTPMPTTIATPSFMDTVTPVVEATSMATPAAPGDSTPVKVVSDFLTSVQSGKSESDSLRYLSSRLRAEGKPIPALLGIQNMYKSFDAQDATLTANAGTSMVRATLNYESGPTIRTLTLIQENGAWVIDAVSPVP